MADLASQAIDEYDAAILRTLKRCWPRRLTRTDIADASEWVKGTDGKPFAISIRTVTRRIPALLAGDLVAERQKTLAITANGEKVLEAFEALKWPTTCASTPKSERRG